MKVVLVGSSGKIGSAVLQECLHNARVTSIVALSRRPLEGEGIPSPKLTNLLLPTRTEFLSYPQEVKDAIADAEACIWTLGAFPSAGREVECDYALAAAREFIATTRARSGKPFKMVFTSGFLMRFISLKEDQSSWIGGEELRKSKTAGALGVLKLGKENPDALDVNVARPAFVIPASQMGIINSMMPTITFPVIAAAFVDIALTGSPKQEYVENAELNRIGKAALKKWSTAA